MKPHTTKLKLFGACACGLWLSLTGHAAAGPITVSPANATISIGQTLQFTATDAIVPTGVSAGGEYTCVRLSDGTARCTGRNQYGQLANGTLTNSSVLVAS